MKNFNNRYFCKNIHRYFTDISDIFVKSNYRYIRVYRYFDPWGELKLRVQEDEVKFNVFEAVRHPAELPDSIGGRTENNILLIYDILMPSRTVTGWRICIDYRKLNKATRKDHFPLPFLDQMLDRLAGHEYYCFLDGYSGYNQIVIAPED